MRLLESIRRRIDLKTLTAAYLGVGACHPGYGPPNSRASSQPAVSPGAEVTWANPRSVSAEATVYQTWQAYLASKNGSFAENAGTPSPLWVAEEQKKWPMYDLAGFYLPDGAVPHVVSIRRADSIQRSAYEIVTRFASPGSGSPDSVSSTVLTMTTFAVLEGGQWHLANALPRKTRNWYTRDVGQISYFVEPSLEFSPGRAAQAVAFVDSLAAAFGIPRLGHLDYYVIPTVDAALQALGAELPVRYGSSGGFSKPVNQQVFSAIPALGENYRHELTHLVLRPLLRGSTMTILASEGIATWFGGTSGADFTMSVRGLATYLTSHPQITLDSMLGSASVPQANVYSSGAVLCAMLAGHGGVPALKGFLLAGPGADELKAALERLLERPWAKVQVDWRQWVDRVARTSSGST